MNIIYNMPQAARAAFEKAHQQRGGKRNPTAGRKKPTAERDYRLTAEYREWRADEQRYREQRANSRRADIQALEARTFLHTQRTPKLTACRLKISQVKAAADKARIAQARSPERVRAAMVRELNTACYAILKDRGLK